MAAGGARATVGPHAADHGVGGTVRHAEGQRHAAAFRQQFQALGWIEGNNIRIDCRWVAGDINRIRTLAKEVVEKKPDLIVAETTPAVTALSRENRAIAIVFVNVSDPLGSGFVASLARPGGAITGFTSNEPTLGGKWPQLLKEIAPAVARAGFMFNPDTGTYAKRSCGRPKRPLLRTYPTATNLNSFGRVTIHDLKRVAPGFVTGWR